MRVKQQLKFILFYFFKKNILLSISLQYMTDIATHYIIMMTYGPYTIPAGVDGWCVYLAKSPILQDNGSIVVVCTI